MHAGNFFASEHNQTFQWVRWITAAFRAIMTCTAILVVFCAGYAAALNYMSGDYPMFAVIALLAMAVVFSLAVIAGETRGGR